MGKKTEWRPVENGHSTGRMRTYEIQVGQESGTIYLYDLSRKRQCHVLPLREFGYALCEAHEVDDATTVPPLLTPEAIDAIDTLQGFVLTCLAGGMKDDDEVLVAAKSLNGWLAAQHG